MEKVTVVEQVSTTGYRRGGGADDLMRIEGKKLLPNSFDR
jgi:hypothetical protein